MPTAHSFEGMRGILNGKGFSPMHFWWGVGLNVVYFAVAIVFFGWIYEKARNRGLLVKQE